MSDVENTRNGVHNPYSEPNPMENALIDKLWRLFSMIISGYVLMKYNMYNVILKSPHINHEWFRVGLACTVAMIGIKSYVELIEGKLRKRKVDYNNFKNVTHIVIVLLLLSSGAYHAALWPHYGWNTPLVLGLSFFGVILQFLLMVPTTVQNAVSFVLLALFIQEYK